MPLVQTKFKSMYLVSSRPERNDEENGDRPDNGGGGGVNPNDELPPGDVNDQPPPPPPPPPPPGDNGGDDPSPDVNGGNINNNDRDDVGGDIPGVTSSPPRPPYTSSGAGPSSFNCPHCDQRFMDNQRLQDHIASNHSDMELYECEHCSYRTTNLDEYIDHTTSHPANYVSGGEPNINILPSVGLRQNKLPSMGLQQVRSSKKSRTTPYTKTPVRARRDILEATNNLANKLSSQNPPGNNVREDQNLDTEQLILRPAMNSNIRPRYYPYPKSPPKVRQRVIDKQISQIKNVSKKIAPKQPPKPKPKPSANLNKSPSAKLQKASNKSLLGKRGKNIPDYDVDKSDDEDYFPGDKRKPSKNKRMKFNVGEKRKTEDLRSSTRKRFKTDDILDRYFE